MRSGALGSPALHLSYPWISLASPITIILIYSQTSNIPSPSALQVGTGQVKWNEDLVRLGVKEATLSVSAIAEKRTLSTAPTGVFFLPQRPYNILGTYVR